MSSDEFNDLTYARYAPQLTCNPNALAEPGTGLMAFQALSWFGGGPIWGALGTGARATVGAALAVGTATGGYTTYEFSQASAAAYQAGDRRSGDEFLANASSSAAGTATMGLGAVFSLGSCAAAQAAVELPASQALTPGGFATSEPTVIGAEAQPIISQEIASGNYPASAVTQEIAGAGFEAPVESELVQGESITQSIGDLRAQGLRDAHHVIQDASVRDLPGYNTNAAPGVQLEGPSTTVGTPHYEATQVQRLLGGGTYAAERQIAYDALRAAGYSEAEATQALSEADEYFNGIGVNDQTITRIPGNRH
jgi:hypothetical protein